MWLVPANARGEVNTFCMRKRQCLDVSWFHSEMFGGKLPLFPAFDFREIYYIIFLTNMTDLDTPYMSRLLKLLLMVVHG